MRLSDKPFYTIQGEGELTGIPSVFIRTSGCNLRCRWCDTPYASWKPEGQDWTIKDIVAEVLQYPAQHCVITGGEPMLAKGIRELAAALKEHKKHLTIETAATIPPGDIVCDLASLSPKLSNSTPKTEEIEEGWIKKHEKRRIQPKVIQEWIENYPFQLKFVVSDAQDLEEIKEILERMDNEIPPDKILLMPEGITAGVIRGRDESLIDLCKESGYRYCNRLHVEIFGNTRGT